VIRRASLAVAAGFVILASAAASAASCPVAVGATVMLRSTDFDPDVFVWDSKQRAIDYAGGHWKSASDVLSHTVLAKPGTRAVIVACEPASAKSRFANATEDTIGIRITGGPNRGKYGWVTSEDIRTTGTRTAAN
jgi:hypothetical protein